MALFEYQAASIGSLVRGNVLAAWFVAGVLTAISTLSPTLASDRCDINTKAGDVCLCQLAELRPTQAAVGMVEVRIRAEKLRKEIRGRSESEFLDHIKEHSRVEPIVIGPGGGFYITDHHHLARALFELGKTTTYCKILDNLSDTSPDAFWKYLQDNNEVYLKDSHGNVITPLALPKSIKDLDDDPFRSLAGAVSEPCGFRNDAEGPQETNYLEFKWADYLRANWSKTNIPVDGINANFDKATNAALQLAIRKEATGLPGYTGKSSCQ
jgi:hypothetical protein